LVQLYPGTGDVRSISRQRGVMLNVAQIEGVDYRFAWKPVALRNRFHADVDCARFASTI
jgi:hypothetical protein